MYIYIYIYVYIYIHSLNDLYRFRRYKNIRKMVSTYIKDCGSKGPASQPNCQSVCLYLTDRLTSDSQSVSLSVYLVDRLTSTSLPVNQSVCP